MGVIDDIAAYLQTNGLGTLGTDIFKSYAPDAVDALIAVMDTGGPKPDIYIPTKSPTFQIFVRAATYSDGKSKMDSVRSLLHRVQNSTIGSTFFYFIHAQSEGGHIGRNDRGLDEFSMNFICRTR